MHDRRLGWDGLVRSPFKWTTCWSQRRFARLAPIHGSRNEEQRRLASIYFPCIQCLCETTVNNGAVPESMQMVVLPEADPRDEPATYINWCQWDCYSFVERTRSRLQLFQNKWHGIIEPQKNGARECGMHIRMRFNCTLAPWAWRREQLRRVGRGQTKGAKVWNDKGGGRAGFGEAEWFSSEPMLGETRHPPRSIPFSSKRD